MKGQIKKSKVTNNNGRGKETYDRYLLSIPKEIAVKYIGIDLFFIDTENGILLRTNNIAVGDICYITTSAIHQKTQRSLNLLHGTVLSLKNNEAILKVDIAGSYYKLPFILSELTLKTT